MESYCKFLDKHSNETDSTAKNQVHQVFGSVAETYHKYRQPYPDELITDAVNQSPLLQTTGSDGQRPHILELGCGPATLSLPLLQRGFQVTGIDPGAGMIPLAKELCKEYVASGQAEFVESTFANFATDVQYDAIIAANSFHWAMAEPDPQALRERLHSLLKPKGTLILFWNFPEPDPQIRDALVKALNETPHDGDDAMKMFKAKLMDPLEETGLFTPFVTFNAQVAKQFEFEEYFGFMKTVSTCIRMSSEEQVAFFRTIDGVLQKECPSKKVPIYFKSFANVSSRVEK